MGLFLRKENSKSEPALYSISASQTILVVGLGNPGKEYDGTRHNIGFECLDEFAASHDFPNWVEKKSLKGHLTHRTIGSTRVILLKPSTFMNNSGEAVKAAQQFYKVANSSTIVIHDELDIPFGTLKTKQAGGSAGHNGLKSVIGQCGEDFGRIRIGIGNDFSTQAGSADFVLGRFTKEEQAKLPKIIATSNQLLEQTVSDGYLTVTTTDI